LITPGCRNVLDLRTAFFARGRRDLFPLMSNAKTLQAEPSSYTSHDIVSRRSLFRMGKGTKSHRTRFVPLCSAQTVSPISTLSPRENGSPPPFAMADPMADFRKSMAVVWPMWQVGDCLGCPGARVGAANGQGFNMRPVVRMRSIGRISN
jgi:hypothetical protein